MRDFEEEYNSIPSNKSFPTYAYYKDIKYDTIFISKNHNLLLWRIKDTYITQEGNEYYIHNIFSEYDYASCLYPSYSKSHIVRFHKKLKIHHNQSGNFVNVDSIRGYIGNITDYIIR